MTSPLPRTRRMLAPTLIAAIGGVTAAAAHAGHHDLDLGVRAFDRPGYHAFRIECVDAGDATATLNFDAIRLTPAED